MTLEEIRVMFEDCGLTTMVQCEDLLASNTTINADNLKDMGLWFDSKGYIIGVDVMMEFVDTPGSEGKMQIVPVFGFHDAKAAMYFKLAFG